VDSAILGIGGGVKSCWQKIGSLVALVVKGFWHQKREHKNIGSRSKKNILAGMNGQDPLPVAGAGWRMQPAWQLDGRAAAMRRRWRQHRGGKRGGSTATMVVAAAASQERDSGSGSGNRVGSATAAVLAAAGNGGAGRGSAVSARGQ
jgi:hypothetical protein